MAIKSKDDYAHLQEILLFPRVYSENSKMSRREKDHVKNEKYPSLHSSNGIILKNLKEQSIYR